MWSNFPTSQKKINNGRKTDDQRFQISSGFEAQVTAARLDS